MISHANQWHAAVDREGRASERFHTQATADCEFARKADPATNLDNQLMQRA
jgi:hypothetical protein